MKRILLLVACLSVALFGSCSNEYDDSQIKSDLEELAARIEAVQQAVTAINADLSTYQGLINALKGTKYIKSVKEENGVVTITYNDGSTATLTPGAKGEQGDKGDKGDQGAAGKISMPQFKIDPADGLWYISLDGTTWEKILDENGNPISGVGEEGAAGEAGAAGKAPVLGVDEQGYWTIDLGNGPERIKGVNGKPIVADPSKIPPGYFKSAKVENGYLIIEVIGVNDPISIPIVAPFAFEVNFAAEESFTAGQTRSFALTQKGVVEIGIERPDGWEVKVTETVVEITAPQTTSSGEITIFANSADGLLKVISVKVSSIRVANVACVVAQDGTGDYKTVQEAINAMKTNQTEQQVIYIKAGTYYEKILVESNKSNITLIGESAATTILTYDDYSGKPLDGGGELGTQNSASFTIKGKGFTAQNLTFENPHKNLSSVSGNHQAVAVCVQNDKATFYDCRMVGYQDTFYVKNHARVYCKECYIEGNVDFIFGDAILLCENCTLHCNRHDSVLTAAAEHTGCAFGFTFIDCKITHIEGKDFNNKEFSTFYLGRPWKQNARVVFIRCEEPAKLNEKAWRRMSDGVDAALFAEYKCTGAGAAPERLSKREMGGRQLTDEEAATYTLQNIFAKSTYSGFGSDWTPPTKLSIQ